MQIDNTIDETSSPNRKTSDNPIEILENDIETVKNDHNDENVYEINPVITWETLQNYRETSDCEPFNIITDKFEKINTKDSHVDFGIIRYLIKLHVDFTSQIGILYERKLIQN